MEKKTPKTSKNSGKPPSQTEKDNTSLEGSKEKGVKENNLVAINTRTVETITVAPADCCDQCGESLRKTPSQCHERRTRIDIIFEKTIEHVDAEIKHCPHCDTKVKGQFPDDMKGPIQYGAGIIAAMAAL